MQASEIVNEIITKIEGNYNILAECIRVSVVKLTISDAEIIHELKGMAEDNFPAIEKMLGTELTNRIINF